MGSPHPHGMIPSNPNRNPNPNPNPKPNSPSWDPLTLTLYP